MTKKKTTEEVVEEVKVVETPAPVEEKKEAPKKTTEEVVEEVKVEETPAPVEEKKEAPKKVKIAKF